MLKNRFPKITGSTLKDQSPAMIIVIAILPALLLFKVLFMGYSLWPADAIYSLPPWSTLSQQDYKGPANELLFDNTFVFYPWFHTVSEMIRHGEFPLWNPLISCGWPLFANSTGFLFPINVVFYVMPLWYAFGLVAYLKFFLSGLFTYLFVRELRIGRVPALISAVSFMFSGFIVGWLGHSHTLASLCLPLLLLFSEQLFTTKTLRSAALLAAAVGCAFLAGHYETTFHVLAAAGLYALFRLLLLYRENRDLRSSLRSAMLYGVALCLGVAVAAIQLLPSWEYINQSSLVTARGSGGFSLSLDAFIGFATSLKGLVLYLVPDFYGNPADHTVWGEAAGMWNYLEQSGYAGILPLFLAILSVTAGRARNARVYFFTFLGLLSLFVVYRLPLIGDAVYNLPIFAKLNNNRLVLIYSFSVSMLAAFGANFLLEADKAALRNGARTFILLLVASLGLAFLLWVLISYGAFAEIVSARNLLGYVTGKLLLFLLWAFIATLSVFLYARGYLAKSVFQSLLVLITIADLLVFASGFWPVIAPERVYPSTPAIDFLRKDQSLHRIYGLGNVMSINTWVPYDLQDIRGYDGISLKNYEELITRKSGTTTFFMFGDSVNLFLANLMNVKYFLLPQGQELNAPFLKKVYAGEINIYQNLNALPRAFIVHRARMANSKEDALSILYRPDFQPSSEAVLGPDFPSAAPELNGSLKSGLSSASVVHYGPREVIIDADMAERGLLILSDTYYPGWTALVDGEKQDIYRADYNFRAVLLEKGKSRVTFIYTPLSFTIGAAISGCAVTVVALAFIVGKTRRQSTKKRGMHT